MEEDSIKRYYEQVLQFSSPFFYITVMILVTSRI